MKYSLYLCRIDNVKDYSAGKRFRFAVVDLDKSNSYPSNFVCNLPMQISGKGKTQSAFLQVFGDRSIEQARALLTGALKTEEEPEVKAEIEKRLKMLEPEPVIQIKCSGCGKLFHPRRVRKYQHNFCEECMKKKFGKTVIFVIPEEGRKPTSANKNDGYVEAVRKGITESYQGNQLKINLDALDRAIKESQPAKAKNTPTP